MTPHEAILELQRRMEMAIIGQQHVIQRLLLTLLCNGNCLLEGLPGLAKTRAVKSLAQHLEAELKRVQFTPDLLPADITGSEIYLGENAQERLVFQPGPIFGNLVLADEINRAPAKVQSALLEAMEERQVTVSGQRYALPDLFMVLATQNPIEQEGTYPLPEAQMDRFLMHISIAYPSNADEVKVLRLVRAEEGGGGQDAPPKVAQSEIFAARKEIHAVQMVPAVENYIVALVGATRRPADLGDKLKEWIGIGASPRGTLALDRTSRAFAWLQGRDHVIPEDVQAVAHDCLRHRISLTYQATADAKRPDDVIDELIRQVAVAV